MNNKQKKIVVGSGLLACFTLSTMMFVKHQPDSKQAADPVAAIMKNDLVAFEKFINAGGKLDATFNVDGGKYMVGELLVKYERTNFIKLAKAKNLTFTTDAKKDFDVYSLAVAKNNPEILSLIIDSKSNLAEKSYGEKKWSLIHMASSSCSHEIISVLHKAGLNWNSKAQDGSTALTVAAEAGCLKSLGYWKEQGANFKANDGRGVTALEIIKKNKDAAMTEFVGTLTPARVPASVTAKTNIKAEPVFYRKRIIPKDILAKQAGLIAPEDRPDDANETADYSEFSD